MFTGIKDYLIPTQFHLIPKTESSGIDDFLMTTQFHLIPLQTEAEKP
jgi:hypothetical protein